MESNGKSVTLDGKPVEWETAAVIWGEPGNNAQHSFFQLLHQGTPRAALDFLLPAQLLLRRPGAAEPRHRQLPGAGRGLHERPVRAGGARRAASGRACRRRRSQALVPHKVHPGSRPSTIVLFEKLDPATLGRLIALYEHKVLTQSVVWGINAFDQWGVELGKKLTEQLAPAVIDPQGGHAAPPAVLKLLATVRAWRE